MIYTINYIICMLSFVATAATVKLGVNVAPSVNL